MLKKVILVTLCSCSIFLPKSVLAVKYNAYGLNFFTASTEHFDINYHAGLERLIPRIGNQFEKLYSIYRNTYGLTLPEKTEVVVLDGDISNGWAFANTNTITIWTHDFDFNLRGSHDWFEDVITHEYAHIVSIQTGLKLPPAIPEIRFGYFSHPNEKNRIDAFQSIATDILPPWFTEGIAQYSSSMHGADRWDTHRDMILRSLTLSNKLLTWPHMQVFAGKGDDFEKTYNLGFSLVKYIAETYGEDKIVALLRESSKAHRFNFDKTIKIVSGKSAHALYNEWKQYLVLKYTRQIDTLNTQTFGTKINVDGYQNAWPRFSRDGKNIYFLSNGKRDYGRMTLCKADLTKPAIEKERIKALPIISSYYDLNPTNDKLCFVSPKSPKSMLPAAQGGVPSSDLFIDTIPPEKASWSLFPPKTEQQVTIRKGIFSATFSPDGHRIACAKRSVDRFYLAITDTSGKEYREIYPAADSSTVDLSFIYSLDWSPDGHHIAFSFFDRKNRKIAIYDTTNGTCNILCESDFDNRDPAYSPDGRYIYFSSDRTGIFNIFRYDFSAKALQQLTNVSGGAFTPALAPDGKRLTYAGYDDHGYSIYLIDTLNVLAETSLTNGITPRHPLTPERYPVTLSDSRPYSHIPRQFLVMPTLIGEQAVSQNNNVNSGVTTIKAGVIVNAFEPLTFSGLGNELGGYFFVEPKHIFDFINPDQRGINIEASYDLGLFGTTQLLPITISGAYLLRGIAGKDWFFNETEGTMQNLPYNVQLQNISLQFSHYIDGEFQTGAMPRSQSAVHLITSLDSYDVSLLLEKLYDAGVMKYNLSKGYSLGTMYTFGATLSEIKRTISPNGIVAKLQYNFSNEYSLKQENSFDENSSVLKELYDTYLFHQIIGETKWGLKAPWYDHHDIHGSVKGSYLKILKQKAAFPSYYLPGAWVPGYAYYTRDTRIVQTAANDSSVQSYDTLVVTGRALLQGELSYRFPLSPKLINKKFGFIYFKRLYGAINVNGASGWDNPRDALKLNRADWLLSYGLELRLEATTFSTYPLAIKLRWDRGIDRPAPVGGDRVTLSVGYDFDGWGMVFSPETRQKGLVSFR